MYEYVGEGPTPTPVDEIDYVVNGLNATVKFRNPNAEAECGCGESFSLATEKEA